SDGGRTASPDRGGASGAGADAWRHRGAGAGAAEAGCEPEEVGVPGLHHLSGGREEVQVAEAASEDSLRPLAGRLSGEVGPSRRLPDGCAELRRGALRPGQDRKSVV